jgi:hypothetical protein
MCLPSVDIAIPVNFMPILVLEYVDQLFPQSELTRRSIPSAPSTSAMVLPSPESFTYALLMVPVGVREEILFQL